MDYKTKVETLRCEVDCTIKYFERKHIKTKHRANFVKISSVCFGAAVTVILGLNHSGEAPQLFMDIALILGSLVTVFNAIDAFYGFGPLWIKNTVTLARLRELRRKILFYAAGREEQDISEGELSKFLDELQQILKDDINQWLRIREKVNSQEKVKELDEISRIQFRSSGRKSPEDMDNK